MSITDNKYNMTMWQGSTFGMSIVVKTATDEIQDLTNYSARMQIRPNYKSTIVTESLTSSNGEIIIVAANGELQLELSAERTAAIKVDLNNGKPPRTIYVYDLEIEDSIQTVSKVLWGDLTVYGEVTR